MGKFWAVPIGIASWRPPTPLSGAEGAFALTAPLLLTLSIPQWPPLELSVAQKLALCVLLC